MCLETAQMLCTAINELGGTTPYKSTHVNHPCNVWIRKRQANWEWLFKHGLALCAEYTKRYGKVHKCEQIIWDLYPQSSRLPGGPMTPFVNCAANKELGIDYKDIDDATIAYQLYLDDRWENDKRTPTWHGRAA